MGQASVRGGRAIEWKRVWRREQAVTRSGILYMRDVYGYECTGCRQIRWSTEGNDRRPEDRCELCFPHG
jgi:hypothetical protein